MALNERNKVTADEMTNEEGIEAWFFLDLREFLVLILHDGKSVRSLPREPGDGKHNLYHNFSETHKHKIVQVDK